MKDTSKRGFKKFMKGVAVGAAISLAFSAAVLLVFSREH